MKNHDSLLSCAFQIIGIVILVFLFISLLFFFFNHAFAKDITFAWDKVDDINLVCYRLYHADVSGDYNFGDPNQYVVIDPNRSLSLDPNIIEYNITGVDGSVRSYWVVTYLNKFNFESQPSNQVSFHDNDLPWETINLRFRAKEGNNYYYFYFNGNN